MPRHAIRNAALLLLGALSGAGSLRASGDFKCTFPDVENIGKREINGRIYLIFPNFISFDKEIQLGAEIAAQMDQSIKFIKDPEIQEYLESLIKTLVRHSDAKVPFRVKLVDSDEVNAFALPGGFLYVNKGLIQSTQTEDELVGVLCHEIAHVAARHATEMMSKMQILNYASIPTIFIGGAAGMIIQNSLGLALDLKLLGVSRGSEKEADVLGAQYAWNAGYDPEGFITFFEKMLAQEKKQPGKLASWFRTHPTTPDRLTLIRQIIAKCLPAKERYVTTSSVYDTAKNRLNLFDNVALSDKKAKKGPGKDGSKPTLKLRTDTETEDDTQQERPDKQEKQEKSSKKGKEKEEDDKPVLKRSED
jgi:predicted Zn-dependent protease